METVIPDPTPARAALQVEPVTTAVGAILGGVDLRQPLDDDTVRDIRQVVLDRGVVFLREQDLTRDQMLAFVARFGEPIPEPFGDSGHKDPVMTTSVTPYRRSTAIWHADVTCIETPVSMIALRAIELPPVGGDTCWGCMYAAYEALSPRLQAMLEGLTAVHTANRVMRMLSGAPHSPLKDASHAIHPVIRVHPETGRKALFVNKLWTERIVELPQDESDYLLAFLYEHVKSPDFTLRWRWRPNDIALWDNRSTQHYAVPDYAETRVMQKIVVRGDRPYGP